MKPLKLLIVDDSRIFRGLIEVTLEDEDFVEVIGSVRNGIKAMEFIAENRPDVVTLDFEMPEMDGMQTLNAIQEVNEADSRPDIGVIMVSAFTHKGSEVTMQALENGAFDFITKPDCPTMDENLASLKRQLVKKLREFDAKRTKGVLPETATTPPPAPPTHKLEIRATHVGHFDYVLIGCSTGGPKALMKILPAISEVTNAPILIVQHMPPTFTASLANSLNKKCNHTVIEAAGNEKVQPGMVYVAPGDYHMVIKKDAAGEVVTALNQQAPENGCRPAVDVMFRSAAAVGNAALTIVLTGMGRDGAKGIRPLKRIGSHIIAQDEESSVVWGMPGAAVETGLVDQILSLDEIHKGVKEHMGDKSGT